MSKLTDRLIAEALFNKEPRRDKRDKNTKPAKIIRRIEEHLLEELEKKMKKEEKKDHGAWDRMSVTKKLVILMITVPLGLMLEMFIILKFAMVIGTMIKPI